VTAPLTLLPAGVAGIAGAALAYKENDDTAETVAFAGGAAAVGLGAALIYEEQNYIAGTLLILVGAVTTFMIVKK